MDGDHGRAFTALACCNDKETTMTSATIPGTAADHSGVQEELSREARMGGLGEETREREVRCIDISDFERRKEEIAEQLWSASVDIGFFQVSRHGIPIEDIRAAFARAEAFFALPRETKAQWPLARNAGWEHKAQIRPSTRTPDQKESYQVTRPRMEGLWPTEEELPGFRAATLAFERQCWEVGMRLLSCFAWKLGFDDAFFTRAHDPSVPAYQSTLRMLHYFAVDPALKDELGLWRAGAHTDFDCLTLLFQRPGQGGLQVLPGKGDGGPPLDARGAGGRRDHLQHRRHAHALERRRAAQQLPPGAQSGAARVPGSALQPGVLLPGQRGRGDRGPGGARTRRSRRAST